MAAKDSYYWNPQDTAAAGDLLEEQVRRELGLSDTPADWDYKDRQSYNNLLSTRLAARPDIYGKQAEIASKYKPSTQDLEEYGLWQVVGDFTGEFARQGMAINPFAEQNRTKSSNTLILVVATVAALAVAYIAFAGSKVVAGANGGGGGVGP